MPAQEKPNKKQVYQLKVTLLDIEPPIWRRIQVLSDITLHELHWTLLTVMGWHGGHLHEFMIGGEAYAELEYDPHSDAEDEKAFKLSQVVKKENEIFHFMYDFGDCWEHEIVLERILQAGKGIKYPICLEGERACPPEDCGGTPGYADLLEILGDPSHPDHEDMFAWLPGDFDSERFDVEGVNRMLRPSGSRQRKRLR